MLFSCNQILKNILSSVGHDLIGCRGSKPCILWPIEFVVTLGVFCKELESMPGKIFCYINHVVDPFTWNPISHKIRDRTDKYPGRLFLFERLAQSLGMKSWFEATAETFVYSSRIAIGTFIETARDRVPRKICPFYTRLIHISPLALASYATILAYGRKRVKSFF